jgi:site-specific DNA-methyltransferase (adenine-specific)
MTNMLYYGDNLSYLREFEPESVDLVYLDPPFNKKATFNLLFHTPEGDVVQAQTAAFKDMWTWETSASNDAFEDVVASGSKAGRILIAFRDYLGQSDMMAYLCMMAVRLIELQKILKTTGSLYLHCDPTACHYLKILLDGIFGPEGFKNEIVWKRTSTHSDSKTWSRVADNILFYTKSDLFVWNTPIEKHSEKYLRTKYRYDDGDGRIYMLDNMTSPNPRPNMMYEWKGFPSPAKGWRYQTRTMEELDRDARIWYPTDADGAFDFDRRPRLKRYLDAGDGGGVMGTIWTDIPPVNSQAKERVGYPTQKPLPLLSRIINASTEPGQIVLDPFCGCGTSIEAAQLSERQWIGIDVTHHAIEIIEGRISGSDYRVTGRPEDIGAARDLARRDKYEFQWWASWLVGAQNYRERKKGADKGIDGIIYFRNGPWGIGQTIVSVKGGENVGVNDINQLAGVVQRDEAQLGILICFEPTPRMYQDAAGSQMAQTAQGRFQRIRVVTVQELLDGRYPPMPAPLETQAFRQPLRTKRRTTAEPPGPQLTLTLPIPGRRQRRTEVEDHLSGAVLAAIS